MFDRYFTLAYRFVHQHNKWVLGLVLAITVLASFGLLFVKYDGSMDLMLPPDKDIRRSMDFLRDSNLTDKIVLSLALTDPARNKQDLFLAADRLAASLAPPLFTKVMGGLSVSDVMEEFSVLRYAPQVLGEQDLLVLDARMTREVVSQKMRGIYRQSLRPESLFLTSLSRTDPIGITALLQEKLRALPTSMGYDVSVEDGHFVSRDGRHTMLIIQTPVPMMDSRRSKELITELQGRLQKLPEFVRADIISGHLHTVNNERVIMRDITVASLVASVAFFLLFLLVFRDPRAFFVFIFPFIAVLWAVIITACIEHTLSYLVIGFGTAIVGISDYGLIVYIAMKRGVDASQTGKLARLVFIDAITTICSFVVLFFSLIHGYHQLALFAVLCLFICLFFALFVLPLTLATGRSVIASDPTIGDRLRKARWPVGFTVGAWVLLTAVFLFFAFSVRFDSDVKKLDGSGPEVFQAEQRFRETWGGKSNQAIFVVTGKDLDTAMEINDRVFRDAIQSLPAGEFTSLALFWPSEKLRKENRARWDHFWKQGRETRLRGLVQDTSAEYGFAESAFAPFFEGLYGNAEKNAPLASGLTERLQERFVLHKNGEYRILSFFPDEPLQIRAMTEVMQKHTGTFIVSGRVLSASISEFTSKEMLVLAPLAVLFNVVLAWLFFRNWKEALISLVPIITGVIWLLGIMSLLDMPLNMVNIIAGIIASGVIVDYGFGITYEYGRNLHFGSVMAMTLSAATNVIGAGALLFAQHPALYSTAVAMVICMIIGYLSAVFVIPSLCTLLRTADREGGAT